MTGLQYLNALDSRTAWTGVDLPKLGAPRRILSCLGNPQDRVPSVHITGTNGKGTVGALLSAMFRASGKQVGQLISPHLQDVTERLLINGRPVSAELLNNALSKIEPVEEKEQIRLSYFEAALAASHLICAEQNLDWAVVEVGVGGRTDATNLMAAPKATVITSIGLDHTNILGETEEEIADHKAGIFRKGVPAIIGPVSKAAFSTIEAAAAALPCPLLAFGEAFWLEGDFVVSKDGWRYELPVRTRRLLAKYQRENFAIAAYTAHVLGLTDSILTEGMRRMRWPGRVEEVTLVRSERVFRLLLDGAHNPDGVRGLVDYLAHADAKRIFILVSILAARDFTEMAKLLRAWIEKSPRPVSMFFSPMEYPGTGAPEKLRETFGTGIVCASKEEAFDKITSEANEEDLIVVTGSLYFVGEVRAQVVKEPFCTIIE